MEKDSALYQLMGTCMNGIVNGDVEYQAFSASPDRMDLSKETIMTGFTSPFSCQEASRSATLATSLSAGKELISHMDILRRILPALSGINIPNPVTLSVFWFCSVGAFNS